MNNKELTASTTGQSVDLKHEKIKDLEALIASLDPVVMPLRHIFTDGLYSRQIFMAAGTILTSRTHKTEHQFIVSKGKCIVNDGETIEEISAPYIGITKPGTKRAIYIEEDTLWTTFHATSETCIEKIEAEILEPLENDKIAHETLELLNKICVSDNTIIKSDNTIIKKEVQKCQWQQ